MNASALYLIAALAVGLSPALQAHESHGSRPSAGPAARSTDRHPWGMEGDPARAVRVVRVQMRDTMRYDPDRIQVRQGDTVTFEVHNAGRTLHEFVIGTTDELRRHADLMKKHPDMEHDEPYMAHVKPGRRQRISWQFTEPGEFEAACLLPGHYEAGMKAVIRVVPRNAPR